MADLGGSVALPLLIKTTLSTHLKLILDISIEIKVLISAQIKHHPPSDFLWIRP